MAKHLGVCPICEQSFTRNRPLRGITCSPKCRTAYRRKFGKGWPDKFPIGTIRIRKCKGGYRYAFRKTESGWMFEHHYVLGGISKGQVTHHVNGNTLDNRPENLRVLTPSEHAHLHCAKGIAFTTWARKYQRCIQCGTMERKHRAFGLCINCY